MTTSEPNWQLSEIRNDSGPMLIRKLLNATRRSGNDYVIYLTFGCNTPPDRDGYYPSADSATFEKIDETDIPALEITAEAILVGAVSAPRVRDFIFYANDPQRFLNAAEHLRSQYPQFQIGCECKPDPDWAQYHDLPPSQPENAG